MVDGPFGPTLYTLGNGLKAVNAYDVMGRATGGWVCSGSSQQTCTGGTQLYGYFAQRSGTHITQTCDTVLNLCNSLGYDEFDRLTSRTVTQGTVQNFTYTYDRYGNRWAQNAPQGGPSLNVSMNSSNNIINTNGFANDIPGNIAGDGVHTYSYDADGNLISVDSAATASYYYDSLNERVREAPTRGTYEFVWDTQGRRVSNWSASNHGFVESNAYSDSNPVAIRLGGQRQFEHQNWLGTERLRTTYNGGVALSLSSLPWGDGLSPSGDDGDQHDFELMDRDLEDNTEHAQYRQYSTNLGRWMSPDVYNGSYDFSNPQSFNRYTYASSDPANFIDPSGLDAGGTLSLGGIGGCVGAASSGGVDIFADIGCGWGLLNLLGGHPSFHGSLQPRPSSNAGWDGNFGESLGIPTSIPQGNFGLGIALGLPSQGCEFGACGGGFTNGSGSPSSSKYHCGFLGNCYLAAPFRIDPFPKRLFGTHYCGPGGAGNPISGLDGDCQIHDGCYDAHGLSPLSNFNLFLGADQVRNLQQCNQNLCDAAAGKDRGDPGSFRVFEYFTQVPIVGACRSHP